MAKLPIGIPTDPVDPIDPIAATTKLLTGFETEQVALDRSEIAWQARLAAKFCADKRPGPRALTGDVTKYLDRVLQKPNTTEWALEIQPNEEKFLKIEERAALVTISEDWQAVEAEPLLGP